MLYCVHSATTFFIFSIYAFISLFTCLFCLPICDFDLSFYMYVCMNIYTKWKTYLEFHNEFFFFFLGYTLSPLILSFGFVPDCWEALEEAKLWRGFTPSTSVSSSITHRRVILCLHFSSLLF